MHHVGPVVKPMFGVACGSSPISLRFQFL